MNYKDFFKKEAAGQLKNRPSLPNVDPNELKMGIEVEKEHSTDEATARTIAMHHLAEDPKYYTHMKSAGLKECGMGDGLPKRDGALDIPHLGQPIHMAKIINVGPVGSKEPASGELSGYTNVAKEPGTKITAAGTADPGVATKSVGGPVSPGEGQKQGGPNTKGCIANTPKSSEIQGGEVKGGKPGQANLAGDIGGTPKNPAIDGGCAGAVAPEDITVDLMEGKKARQLIRNIIGECLEELNEGKHKAGCQCGFCKNKGTFGKKAKDGKKEDKKDDKKAKGNPFAKKDKKDDKKEKKGNPFAKKKDKVDECFEAGPQYKVAGPQYRTAKDDWARSVAQTPEMTENQFASMNPGNPQAQHPTGQAGMLGKKSPGAIKLDIKKIVDPEVEGVDRGDYPDFSDAYISSAYYPVVANPKPQKQDWRELTDDELDWLNDQPAGRELAHRAATQQYTEYDPTETVTEVGDETNTEPDDSTLDPATNIHVNVKSEGHKGQKGYKLWVCERCGLELVRNMSAHGRPNTVSWRDGHTCRFVEAPNQATPPGGGLEEQSYKVGDRSYRTFDDSPQFPDAVHDPKVAEESVVKEIIKSIVKEVLNRKR